MDGHVDELDLASHLLPVPRVTAGHMLAVS